jgi:predicted Zn-dependent peptidase
MREYQVHTFPNGIRLVHIPNPHSQISYCGMILDIGSRDEQPHQKGIAHFWEHMAFKGTEKRKNFHILNRMDSVGGEINAYTSKEKICFYSTQLTEFLDRAIELLTDITFFSVFPEKEIEKERHVILEEMSMYQDDPSDSIADDFDGLLFSGHSLGYNILGTKETVSSFQKSDFQNFIVDNLSTDRIVLSVVSSLPFNKIVKFAQKYLQEIPQKTIERKRIPFKRVGIRNFAMSKPIMQSHCVMGGLSCSKFDELRVPFYLLNNLLGGSGMNSRLNLGIREKYGYAYDIQANSSTFYDTGYFTINFGTEPKNLLKCIHLVEKELKLLCEKKLGTAQLQSAKQQLKGQLAIAEEGKLHLMLLAGKSILDKGEIESLTSIFEKIEKINAIQLMEVANKFYNRSNLSQLIYLPENKS